MSKSDLHQFHKPSRLGYCPECVSSPQPEEGLREAILTIIKGYEPVGHLDGTPEQNVIPSGYDLGKDERTEYGFYWEYEDMEDCADKIAKLVIGRANILKACGGKS